MIQTYNVKVMGNVTRYLSADFKGLTMSETLSMAEEVMVAGGCVTIEQGEAREEGDDD